MLLTLPPVFAPNLNRTQALDQMFDDVQQQRSELPRNVRSLGGGFRDGLGEYYRQMLTLTRRLDQNALGNWRATHDERSRGRTALQRTDRWSYGKLTSA